MDLSQLPPPTTSATAGWGLEIYFVNGRPLAMIIGMGAAWGPSTWPPLGPPGTGGARPQQNA
eukprot:5314790-Pyramimonas_sp.AAC.2